MNLFSSNNIIIFHTLEYTVYVNHHFDKLDESLIAQPSQIITLLIIDELNIFVVL